MKQQKKIFMLQVRQILAMGLLLGLTACQTVYVPQARDVKRKPKASGTIALPLNHRDEDRQKAESMMSQNCAPVRAHVLEEGEVAVGQETKSSSNETNRDDSRTKVGSLFGLPVMSGEAGGKNTNQSSTVTQIKEWQISYECETELKKTKR